jgi:hypothetical protein
VEGAARPGRRSDVLPGQAAQRPGRVSISLLAKIYLALRNGAKNLSFRNYHCRAKFLFSVSQWCQKFIIPKLSLQSEIFI